MRFPTAAQFDRPAATTVQWRMKTSPDAPCCPNCLGPMVLIRKWLQSRYLREHQSYQWIVCGVAETFEWGATVPSG
jgi:hypothetical protein